MGEAVRYCVLSDIHGNLPALEAVLADASRHGYDRLIDLGDSVSGPLWPAETADRLMSLAPLAIRGNHERQVLTHAPERMGPSDAYAARTLQPRHLDYFRSLPASRWLPDRVLLVHGSPRSDLEYFLEVQDGERVVARPAEELPEWLGEGAEARLIVCGHTHVPRTRKIAQGGPLIVNPGSVGLQAYSDDHPTEHRVENGDAKARYALITDYGRGLTVSLMSVAYDHERAARQAEANNRPDWAVALRHGRMSDPNRLTLRLNRP
jgi:predicted phosphodiesterase